MKTEEEFETIVDEEIEDSLRSLEDKEKIPDCTSPEWVDFVLGNLTDSELVMGSPTTDGLRRVTERYFGEILESNSEPIDNKAVGLDYAIIKHTLVICKRINGSIIKVSACVDVLKNKLPPPFDQHLISTACTRAEGKALRRALKIRVHTVEELTNSDDEEDSKMANALANDQQVTALKVMCQRNNVDLVKFIKDFSNNNKLKNMQQLQYKEAANMLEKLSFFTREGVPQEFVGYKSNWAEKFGD